MKELTEDNLKEVVSKGSKIFVQYGASWCGACRLIKPKINALEDDYSDVDFYYVDAEKFPESRGLAKVENLPTFAVFNHGEVVNQAMGTNIEKIKGII